MGYRYEFDKHGMLALVDPKCGDNVAYHNPSDNIAFFIEDGSIFKHGAEGMVQNYAAKIRKAMGAVDPTFTEGMEVIVLPVEKLTDDMLEEINACLATTGRANDLAAKLNEMSEQSQVPAP